MTIGISFLIQISIWQLPPQTSRNSNRNNSPYWICKIISNKVVALHLQKSTTDEAIHSQPIKFQNRNNDKLEGEQKETNPLSKTARGSS